MIDNIEATLNKDMRQPRHLALEHKLRLPSPLSLIGNADLERGHHPLGIGWGTCNFLGP